MKIFRFTLIAFVSFHLLGFSSNIFHITDKTKMIIQKGDITLCPADAIVNAANEQLAGGGGVCGAIFNAAGWSKLQNACNNYPLINGVRCPTGQSKITDSFNLKSNGIKYIIHAVGPDCRIIKDTDKQNYLLSQSYTNSLILADENNLESIAFPFISSAIYAFPKKRAAKIAIETIINYIKNNNINLKIVYIILFSQEDFDLFSAEIELN